jgi:hypothetical protein
MNDARLHGLDYIRLISFFAIATFHVSLIHYHTPAIDIAEQSLVIKATEQISRVLSFSGFTICFLSSLLTAFSGSSLTKRIRLFAFLLVGWTVFSALMSTPEDTWLVWDIYPLIFSGILLCTLVQARSEKVLRALGILGFCMLWVPFWEFGHLVALPAALQTTLGFSDCATDVVEWPVFPWLGLVTFGYWAGNEARRKWQSSDRSFFRISSKEGAFWAVALAASTLEFGNFYGIKLGSAFACEAYRQPPVIWWSHFLWPLAMIRLSFDPRVQDWLGRFRLSRFVSNLAINRKFWLAYFTNYLFCYVLSMLVTWSEVERTEWNTTVIAFIAVFLVPMTEVLVRIIIRAAGNVALLFKRPVSVAVTAEAANDELHPLRNQRGASLMAVMIASAVIGGIVGGITMIVNNRTDQRMLRNAMTGKEFAFEMVRQSAASPDALKVTASKDPALNNCLLVDGKLCTNTNANSAQTLVLYVPYAAKSAPVAVTAANSNSMDARYNSRGLRSACDPNKSETCLYWATAQWWAQCPNKAASCDQAVRIFVIPQIRPLKPNGAKVKGHSFAQASLAQMPRPEQITEEKKNIAAGKATRFAASVMVSDINGAQMQQCPQGSLMAGTMEDGIIKCQCAYGYVQSGTDSATGWPVCTPLKKCKVPKILAGIDKFGEPLCYDPKGTSYNCQTKVVGSNGTVVCPEGYRMNQVQPGGECFIKTDDIGKEYVDCGEMTIGCCTTD